MKKERVKQHEMDMCTGSIPKKMFLFAVPVMFSSILQLLFNAADVVVVGRFAGDNSLAAVGSNAVLISLITSLFIGMSVGVSVTTGHFYGAKQEADLNQTVHTAILMSLFSGIFMTVLGVVGARQILIWMQTPDEVMDLAVLYLRIYFLGMTAMMVYNFGAAILRAVGDSKRPLYFLLTAGIINVILNMFFVIVLKMDVAGVALGTVISQSISAFLIIYCLLHEDSSIRLVWKQLRIYPDKLQQILQVGLPAGFEGFIFALSCVVIQSAINSFGPVVVAGSSAAANLENFVYYSMNAFYQAALAFISQNVGAKSYFRIRRILFTGLLYVVTTGLIVGNLVVFFGEPLLGLYSPNPEVVATGMVRVRILARTYVICGMLDIVVGTLRGLGYSVLPTMVSLVWICGIRLTWLATVFQMERFHSDATVYCSFPISWTITLSVHICCLLWVHRRLRLKYQIVF
ncbi:MAG: MATE family efflux transporter [Lachnospiraceae bacterium]|nr:MATE family efflux transporter [Lachnospiraceae bacterium]